MTDVSKSAGPAGIQCRAISHWFDDVQVLDRVTLDLKPHAFVSLLGPSGCGKTTLLRIIDGLIKPSDGEVRVGGERVVGPAASRGMVFQEHNLLPWKSAIDNVKFGLKLVGVDRSEWQQRAQAALVLAGLAGFEHHLPSQLSGGMKQRVGLARALAIRPATLLMDEPFGALDAQTRTLMQEELLAIWNRSPMTVVFVTHDVREAVLLADRVAVMTARPGRLKAVIDTRFPGASMSEIVRAPEYVEKVDQIWNLVREEAAAAVAGRHP